MFTGRFLIFRIQQFQIGQKIEILLQYTYLAFAFVHICHGQDNPLPIMSETATSSNRYSDTFILFLFINIAPWWSKCEAQVPRSCWRAREVTEEGRRNWDITDMMIKAIFQAEIPPSLLWGQNVKIVLLKLSKHHLLSPCVAHVKSQMSNEEQLDGFSEFTACWTVLWVMRWVVVDTIYNKTRDLGRGWSQ